MHQFKALLNVRKYFGRRYLPVEPHGWTTDWADPLALVPLKAENSGNHHNMDHACHLTHEEGVEETRAQQQVREEVAPQGLEGVEQPARQEGRRQEQRHAQARQPTVASVA